MKGIEAGVKYIQRCGSQGLCQPTGSTSLLQGLHNAIRIAAADQGKVGQVGEARDHYVSVVFRMGCAYCACHQEGWDSSDLQ